MSRKYSESPEGEQFELPLEEDYDKRDPAVLATKVTRDVPERFRGTWGGWLWPNEWQSPRERRSVMTCCVGNMAMHFYRVWRDMVDYDDKTKRFSVNLLMNRAAAQADVNSHIPYRGQVDVKLKTDCEVAMRIPEWTTPAECRCTVNAREAQPAWQGRYMIVTGHDGDEVSLHCPIPERTESRTIQSKDYRVTVRGNEIVDIDPPGENCPIFNRPELRNDEAQWKTVERFVSDGELSTY